MSTGISKDFSNSANTGQWFCAEAAEVLTSLRKRVATVLSDLGNFNRPADLQHSLALDKTLGRQIFKLACTAEPLGTGSVVPSRTSVGRFLDSAKTRGIAAEKLANVWTAYEEFEKLVQTHAGDRVTFNSMVAAASGVDDEWLATDLQHRRNAFRALSHTMGIQAKTRLRLAVINEVEDGAAYSIAMVSGFIGLRILRAHSSIRVDGIALRTLHDSTDVACEPLELTDAFKGYLLDTYSSSPLPSLTMREHHGESGQSLEILLDHPKIGNTGASTLMFGSLYPRIEADSEPLSLHVIMSRPTEILLFDVLAKPGLVGGGMPVGKAVLGYNEKFGEELMPMEGKFNVEFLGKGPGVLATPEVPRYTDMIGDLSDRLKWDLEEYNAYRIRVEFPLYHSTISMSWIRS